MSRNRAEVGEENYQRFLAWVEERKEKNDYVRFINKKGMLHRSQVAEAIGLSRGVLTQNPRCKELCESLDKEWGSQSPYAQSELNEKALNEALDKADAKIGRVSGENSRHMEEIARLQSENQSLKLQLANLENFKTARAAFLAKTEALK